jgi:hypothetical protein
VGGNTVSSAEWEMTMSQLINWLSKISVTDPAVWLALGSGMSVVLIFLFLGRRQRRATVIASDAEAIANPADIWLPPSKSPDERRRSVRRSGVPTSVQIVDPKKPKRPIEGYVLDRSSGGLRLAMEKPFSTGLTLQIRPTNAPSETPWIPIIIRSCREVGDYFEVGSQFMEELPWHLLLMFG